MKCRELNNKRKRCIEKSKISLGPGYHNKQSLKNMNRYREAIQFQLYKSCLELVNLDRSNEMVKLCTYIELYV